MNADAKKTVLRMIPYGIYVLTADDGKGNISAATVNWVTQIGVCAAAGRGRRQDRFRHLRDGEDGEDVRAQHARQGAKERSPSRSSGRPTSATAS